MGDKKMYVVIRIDWTEEDWYNSYSETRTCLGVAESLEDARYFIDEETELFEEASRFRWLDDWNCYWYESSEYHKYGTRFTIKKVPYISEKIGDEDEK